MTTVKHKLKDDLETKPILKKHKKVARRSKTVFVSLPSYAGTADMIDFFKDVGQVVRVHRGVSTSTNSNKGFAFVQFASAYQAEKALQKRGGELHGCHVLVREFCPPPQPLRFFKDHKLCNRNYTLREEEEPPSDFVENVLFVSNLSPQAKIPHIIDFFSYVGEVVGVRLIVSPEGKHVGYGFVQFVSVKEAQEVLKLMDGEYLLDHKIFLDVAKLPPYHLRTKFNLAEKLCYEDYVRRRLYKTKESELFDETPSFAEAVSVRKKTLFFYNLTRHNEIPNIINFFKDVGQVVHVRLFLDCDGNQIGEGFVEFASVEEAKKAIKKKMLKCLGDQQVALWWADATYPDRERKYCIDHKVRYEDYLREENLLIEEGEAVEGDFVGTTDFSDEVASRKKTLFVYNLAPRMHISNITTFYKDVGEVCAARLVVNDEGEHVGCAFVEFASVNEAEMVLQHWKVQQWNILSDVAEMAPYPIRPKYNLAEKLWNKENQIQGENKLLGEILPRYQEYWEEDWEEPTFYTYACGKKMTFSDDSD